MKNIPVLLMLCLLLTVPTNTRADEQQPPSQAAPSWPCFHGPNGNFSATDCGLTLVDDLRDAKLLWKSQEPTPPGAAQRSITDLPAISPRTATGNRAAAS